MSEKPESVQKLQEFANEKGINMPDQIAITNHFFADGDKLFAELDEYDAAAILDRFDKKGYTYWINHATGQTDITDQEQVNPAESSFSKEDTVKPALQLSQILDEESGNVVEISDDMRRIAHSVQQRIEGATIITAFLIQLVRDEKLYLAFGCGSFKEYADTMLPFNRRTAYKYIEISEEFSPLLPSGLNAKSVSSMTQIEEKLSSDETVQELSSLGMTKLYQITRIPEADFEQVMDKGVVKMPDGTEWSLEDIKAESSRKVAERVKDTKKQYQKRIANLEEDKKKAREERDHYKGELDNNQDTIDRARKIEQKYGAEAAKMEEIEYLLADSEAGLRAIENHFGKIDIGVSDPDELKERAMSLMRRMTMQLEAARRRFEWLDDMDAFSVFPAWKLAENDGELGVREVE